MKDLLYIDVDDTIIAQVFKGSGYDLRPNVMTQLTILTRLFNCRWLTYWSADRIYKLMGYLYGASLNGHINWVNWQENDPANKAVTVVAGPRNFWWLENPLFEEEEEVLKTHGLFERYVEVSPTGARGFGDACLELFSRKGITEQQVKKVGGRIEWFLPTV